MSDKASMLLEQLGQAQKRQLSLLGGLYACLALYLPLALAYQLPTWPAAVLEAGMVALFYRYGKRPTHSHEVPWLLLLVAWLSHPALLSFMGLVHPRVAQTLGSAHAWMGKRMQTAAAASLLLVLTHVISCGWLVLQPPQALVGAEKYVWGIYWTVTTLATVGYGDITPASTAARVYAMVVMMAGVSGFAIFVSHFSRLLISRDGKLEARRAKLRGFHAMLLRYKIPEGVKREAFTLYHHILEHKTAEDEESMLADLPPSLREELRLHMRVTAIQDIEVFKGLDSACLQAIARHLDEKFYQAGETVVSQGQIGREMFIIHHGEVEILKEGKRLGGIMAGQVFGEMSLIEDQPRSADVVTRRYSHLLIMTKDAFERIKSAHPEFGRRFLEVKRSREAA